MKKRSIQLLALLLAVVLVLPGGAFAVEGERADGTAHIASEPAGADVYVDGELYAADETPQEPVVFNDVAKTAWYYDAVNYAVEHKLMNGVGGSRFAPDDPMTRAMLVTVLWRYEGEPNEGRNGFADVPNGQWYTDAVAWAAHNGIVTGVGNNCFEPDGKITREQLAAILYRYSESKSYDTSARGDFSPFPDRNKVSAWATDACCWAVGAGLISGNEINGRTLLDPQGSATRAQVATILMRFIKRIAKPEITIVSN